MTKKEAENHSAKNARHRSQYSENSIVLSSVVDLVRLNCFISPVSTLTILESTAKNIRLKCS